MIITAAYRRFGNMAGRRIYFQLLVTKPQMKSFLTILAVAYMTITFGQTSNLVDTKRSHKGFSVIFIDSLKILEVIGTYVTSNHTAGYRLILDSNQTFQTIGFDCISKSTVDSGQWSLLNRKTLLLKSDKIVKAYDFFKLESYYFIIPQLSRQKFIKDYMSTKAEFQNAKPFIVDGKIYSVDLMIAICLTQKYFAKEFKDLSSGANMPLSF